MNLHMPQDPESETELKKLAAVPYQIISPANNSPIIGIYQDSMLGSYQFTRSNISFTPKEAMTLLMMFKRADSSVFKKSENERITNFEILSQILPPMSMKMTNSQYRKTKSQNDIIEIVNGEYIKGQIDKGILGGGSRGLIHRICNDFGNMSSSNFIDDLQNIITEYVKHSSFSVGISDLITDQETNNKIIQLITDKKTEVKNLIQQVQMGIFENNSGKTNEEEFETKISNMLNKVQSEAGRAALNNLSNTNRFVVMYNAGSKGGELNIQQMTACLGQQSIEGKRVPYGFEHRTLPHYTKFDDSPGARGFVESSFINGMTPQEVFFHAMGGRIGLIDTAVKTSTTGYIQRRLIKSLEDAMVNYDMTVRNNKNKIIQFSFGEDSIDTSKVENQEFPVSEMTIQDVYSHYLIMNDDPNDKGEKSGIKSSNLSKIFTQQAYSNYKKQINNMHDVLLNYANEIIDNRKILIKNVFGGKSESIVRAPVAFAYIIKNIMGQQFINSNSLVDISIMDALGMIESAYNKLEMIKLAKPSKLFRLLYFYYLSPKDLLINKRFNRKSLEILLETIILTYKRAIVNPGEMVGMVAAQSIGEPTTQLTLNSVIYETPIIVRNSNGTIEKIEIGKFIEDKILSCENKEYYPEKDTTYAPLSDYYEIPSCDENGNMVWKRIEAVTRHPVINKDGSNLMLKVTTKENREVIATKAKSFLRLTNGKIIGVNGDELKIGDYLPVSRKTIDFKQENILNLKDILPPSEYIYSSEIEKAKEVMYENKWWSKHQGKTFTLPYKRSDTFISQIDEKIRRKSVKSKTQFKLGCVYTTPSGLNKCNIPENIELNYNFGYLLGAYSVEGCMTKNQISISNNDDKYLDPILSLCDKWNITTKIYNQENKIKEGWRSQDVRIYSTMLCRIVDKLCGKLSHNKSIHSKIIFSNEQCILGFLDAYIGGDGYINTRQKCISVTSVSKNLLIDVQQMFNILGISSYIIKGPVITKNNRGTLAENIHQAYSLSINGNQLKKIIPKMNIKIDNKQQKLQILLKHDYVYEVNKYSEVIPDEIDGIINYRTRNGNEMNDTIFDRIISIEEVSNTTNYAYDLTIEETRTFNIYNGLTNFDTFHAAGAASKSNVTRGVPRIEELLALSSQIKNPSLTIYLNQDDETDKQRASVIQYMIEHTKLEEIVKSIGICFDPDDMRTLIDTDKEIMSQFNEFEQMMDGCLEGVGTVTMDEDSEKSRWIIRMELDPEVMLEKNITMDDVHFALKNSYNKIINCVYSDYNSEKLIFRIRMNEIVKSDSKKKGIVKIDTLDQSDQIYVLKNFQEQMLNSIVLRGIKNIDKVILRKVKDNLIEKAGSFTKQDIWVLDTIGTNLMDILGLDYIDPTKTISNDVMEVFDVLGIEAARQSLYNEISEVLEFDGSYINAHHMSLLCDRMTHTTKMISVFRHGINNDDIGPIAKASFEETPEMFLKAARHAELDNMRGISANIMCGQEGLYGTSSFQLVLDMDEMIKLEQQHSYEYISKDKYIDRELIGNLEDENDICSTSNLTIKTNISNLKRSEMKHDEDYDPFA
jgi:DNA-directed RNA polymerase beta' subunit